MQTKKQSSVPFLSSNVQKNMRFDKLESPPLQKKARRENSAALDADTTMQKPQDQVQASYLPTSTGKATYLHRPRACYICKSRFWMLHHFYSDLCPKCATLNWQKRNAGAFFCTLHSFCLFSIILLGM